MSYLKGRNTGLLKTIYLLNTLAALIQQITYLNKQPLILDSMQMLLGFGFDLSRKVEKRCKHTVFKPAVKYKNKKNKKQKLRSD